MHGVTADVLAPPYAQCRRRKASRKVREAVCAIEKYLELARASTTSGRRQGVIRRHWPCSIGAKEFNPYFQYLWEYLVGGSLPTAISADHIPPASPFNPIFLLFSYRTALAVTVTTLVVDGKGINTSHSIPLD